MYMKPVHSSLPCEMMYSSIDTLTSRDNRGLQNILVDSVSQYVCLCDCGLLHVCSIMMTIDRSMCVNIGNTEEAV